MNIKSGQRIGNLICVGWIITTGERLGYWETRREAEKVAKGHAPVGVAFQEIDAK